MDASLLQVVGQIAGIGGISLGVLLVLFREIIRKKIFPMLPAQEAYKLLRLLTGAVWSVAIVGIVAWVYVSSGNASPSVAVGPGGVGVNGNMTNSSVSTVSGSVPPDLPTGNPPAVEAR